uniref:Uncharacterized protein n=1 Tax=Ananas comosus var. bracteatus TaxID=296719 RepID=A0A6V7NPZ9_ANACO|nr:unnamed protein product [Ananas comosus var. bracteatus]
MPSLASSQEPWLLLEVAHFFLCPSWLLPKNLDSFPKLDQVGLIPRTIWGLTISPPLSPDVLVRLRLTSTRRCETHLASPSSRPWLSRDSSHTSGWTIWGLTAPSQEPWLFPEVGPAQGGGGGSLGFLGLSILSFRRTTPPSSAAADHFVGAGDDGDDGGDLEGFQALVADLLLSLLPAPSSGDLLVTLDFLSRLLDALLACELRFRSLVLSAAARNPSALSRPPLDRLVADLLDRALKALDLCNAASLALLSLRPWRRHAHIAASALLLQNPNPNPRLRRARRALHKLLSDPVLLRSASFGSAGSSGGAHARSLSWSVSKNWAAGRPPPPPPQPAADLSGGLALAVYTMSSVLGLAMWALAAAVPCGGCGAGAATAFSPAAAPPRILRWAAAMAALQERIAEELRRRERKGGAAGCLRRCRGWRGAGAAAELDEACRAMEAGLGPLERQVRSVFHRIACGRAEVLHCLGHSATTAAAAPRASPQANSAASASAASASASAVAAAAIIPVALERVV